MKSCELCGEVARIYCESDQASLCWSCDEKVHAANFLVAKHCRNVLCQACQSPTPWKASGSKLGPTVSICESCFSLRDSVDDRRQESFAGNYPDDDDEFVTDDDLGNDDDEDDTNDEEEDGENQVVPWTVTPPSLPVASSSSSQEDDHLHRLKRRLDSGDEIGCSSSKTGSFESFRKLKQRRRTEDDDDDDQYGQTESRSTATIDSLKRFQSEMITTRENASATILGACRLSRYDHSR